ncbi:hypothetical protein [Jiella marina]|uniref:hypothetical protein n=1 Tax=Jiella sp. LLJ827 TaxID=2917712 RepID=UPI00210133DF|nr:hypothetical protein [Jiella sp. LLJ827]MCQ0987554.1 hypothetical protein [Jiella sp. LLJ827]
MQILLVTLLAVWLCLAGLGAAHADPISAIAAIGSFLASGTFLANLAIAAIGTALKFAVSLLTKQEKASVSGTKTEITVGGDTPASFIMGRYATPGHLVYANTRGRNNGAENAFLVQVISLGDLPGQNMTGLWIDDEKIDISDFDPDASYSSDGWPVPGFESDDSGQTLWIRYHDGTQTESDALLVTQFEDDPDYPWDASMVGRGVPYIVVTAVYEPSLFSGIPKITVETDGIPLYDPRRDSSVGGAGSQRWSDPSTWEPSNNPIVQAYNIKRGIRYEGEWIWGGQSTSAWQLPLANWFAAMNACDAPITLSEGGTERQFRSGVEVTLDVEPADVLDELLKGCNGRIAEIGGIYKVSVGAPAAPVYSFTDGSIIITRPQQMDPFPGLQQTTNGARASYPEPEEKWASKDAPPYYRSDFEALDDGRRLLADLQFPTVPYATQIQRLIKAAVEDSRRFRTHRITLLPETWAFEPMDVFAWSSDRNGYVEKRFLVTAVYGGSNLLQTFELKEIDPSDYSWTPAIDQKAYSTGRPGAIRPTPQSFAGWQVAAADIFDPATGRRRPSIEVSYAGGLLDITDIRVQVRLAATGDVIFDATKAYDAPLEQSYSVVLNGTFLPETAYEARGIYRSVSGRPFVWSDWLPVTTGAEDLRLGLEQLAQAARDLIDGLRTDIDQAVADADQLAADLQAQAQALAAEAQARADAVADLASEDEALAGLIADEEAARVAAIADQVDALDAERLARQQAVAAQAAALQTEAEQRLADIRVQASDLRALSSSLLDIDAVVAETATLGLDDVQELRTRLDLTRDAITAAYTQAITLATGPGSALVQRLEVLEVEIDDEASARSAEVERLDQAIVTGDAAEASAREVLSVQVRGDYEGSEISLAGGMIGSLRSTFTSQYQAITQSLVSIQAGVDEQFDFYTIWLFDEDIEGWNGNGLPTWVSGGWMRPAQHLTDPFILSPDGIGVPADQYGQVRMRIRRVGTPAWEGTLWWNKIPGDAFQAVRSLTISEPAFSDDDTAVIVFSPEVTGSIERLRIDLSTEQSAANYFEIDWIAIGRPSPGASIASQEELRQTLTNAIEAEASSRQALATQLTGHADPTGATLGDLSSGLIYEERVARSTAVASLTESITGLESAISDAETGLASTASAVDSLTTRVGTAEATLADQGEAIVSNSQALTALEGELDGKADASAVDALEQEIAVLGGEGLQSQASAIRRVEVALLDLAMETAEQGAADAGRDQAVHSAVAGAQQQIDANARRLEGRIDVNAAAITTLNAALPEKASVNAFNSLSAEVSEQGDAIDANAQALTSLDLVVAGKASATLVDTLSGTVTQQGQDIAAINEAITSLEGEIDGKAETSALSSLATTVSEQGDAIDANAAAVTGLQSEIADKAEAAALNNLATTVSEQGDAIDANSQAVTSLSAAIAGKADLSAFNLLSTTVTQQGQAIQANSQALTVLTGVVEDKADASAVDALEQEIAVLGGEGLQSQARAIRRVEASLLAQDLETAEQGALDLEGDDANRAALAQAYQQLEAYTRSVDGRVDAQAQQVSGIQASLADKADAYALTTLEVIVSEQGDAIDANAAAVTSLSGAVSNKADLSALQSLSTTVTQQGQNIAANTQAITSLGVELDDKASADALSTLGAVVIQQGDEIDANSQAITSLGAALDDKAEANALNSLQATVTQQGQDIDANSQAITALSSEIADKAEASAVNTLSTAVSELDGAVTAQGEQLTAIEASADEYSAGGRFRTVVTAQPSGSEATMAMQVRAGDADSYRDAGIFLRAGSGGASEVIVFADQFTVTDSQSEYLPFSVAGGVLQVNAAIVGSLIVEGTITAQQIIANGISASYVDTGEDIFAARNTGAVDLNRTTLLTRTLAVEDTETVNLVASYNSNTGATPNLDVGWAGFIELWKDSVMLSRSRVIGPIVDRKFVSSGIVSAVYTHSGATATAEFKLIMALGTGGTVADEDYNNNKLESQNVSYCNLQTTKLKR